MAPKVGLTDAGWSSSVARRAHNPEVAGSNPVPATTPEEPGPSQDRAPLFCLFGRPSEERTGLEGAYVMAYAYGVSTIPVTTARSQLYRLIDQVNEDSEPLVITGQRGNAVLVGEEDWRAIQETLYLESVPGMMDSIRNARREGIEAGSEELDW